MESKAMKPQFRELLKMVRTHGFVQKMRTTSAIGCSHPDGRTVAYDGKLWLLSGLPSGEDVQGSDLRDLQLAINGKPVGATRGGTKIERLMSALNLLKGDYDLSKLKGDAHYTMRMRLVKRLSGSSKVLARDCTLANLTKLFLTTAEITDIKQFPARAVTVFKIGTRRDHNLKTSQKAEIATVLRRSAHTRAIVKGPAIKPPIIRKSVKERTKEIVELEGELARKIAKNKAVDAEMPVARPRADAKIVVKVEDIKLLEDPRNGIAIMQVERSNSQGAICVYNNGMRVACGVIPTETLQRLRPVSLTSQLANGLGSYGMILQACNQLLTPIVAGVEVTETAKSHLTAILNCKEITTMATKTAAPKTSKFAAPAKAVKKAVAVKAEKPAKAVKAVKAVKAEKPAKVVAKKATKKAASTDGTQSMYTGIKLGRLAGRKIKVLNKVHGAREGTKRAQGMDIILKSKNTDEALEKLEKIGADATYFKHAVAAGLVELGDAPAAE